MKLKWAGKIRQQRQSGKPTKETYRCDEVLSRKDVKTKGKKREDAYSTVSVDAQGPGGPCGGRWTS
jgi:hypothetical protein